jgi:hypothetical protein
MQIHATRRALPPLCSALLPLFVAAFLCSGVATADAPADALTAISDAAAALVNDDVQGFLDQFDRDMPGYSTLRAEVEGLLGASTVGSTIDVISNDGDDGTRTLELDWVLVISAKNSATGGKETRRGVVKCRAERKGKAWKITALEPVEFFQ